jgi:hypothetical protein
MSVTLKGLGALDPDMELIIAPMMITTRTPITAFLIIGIPPRDYNADRNARTNPKLH